MRKIILLVGVLALLLAGCGSPARISVEPGDEIAVPEGYVFIEASSYGQFIENVTFYIQSKESGRIYEYQYGVIGSEIVIPEGYSLVGVSAYGRFLESRTFYCQKNGTNQVFVCLNK